MSQVRSKSNSGSGASGTGPDRELRSLKKQLREALPRLQETYAVERLYLHGSRVKGEAGRESDLDVLVDFQDSPAGRKISLLDFISLKQELEELLGMDVDLGERKALEGPAGKHIRKEAQTI